MLWNIAINDAGASYDPLTLLRTRTTFGRPDWMSVYGKIKQAIEMGGYLPGSNAQLKTKVAVRNTIHNLIFRYCIDICIFKTYFCGPRLLAKVIKKACVDHTDAEIEFTFTKVCHLSNTQFFAT